MTILSKPLQPISIDLLVEDSRGKIVTSDFPYVTIKYEHKYFNGITFVDSSCKLSMSHIGNGIYTYVFTPQKQGIYTIIAKSDDYSAFEQWTQIVHDPEEDNDGESLIIINQDTVLLDNGDSTKILDSNKRPLAGVSITCYDAITKNVVGVSQSDQFGDWSMVVPKGNKIFLFEKDGYDTISVGQEVAAICPL